jgi:hypothetical protein
MPVFGLNAVFAILWVVSGLLFRRAADPWSKIPGDEGSQGAKRERLENLHKQIQGVGS